MRVIKVGLYKHGETDELDVMINSIDNTRKVHNGEFDEIAEFVHVDYSKDELKKFETLNDRVRELHDEFSELMDLEQKTENKLLKHNLKESQKNKLAEILALFPKERE